MNDPKKNAEPLRREDYQSSRLEALADGSQIEITKSAAQAKIPVPVFITRGVYDQCVAITPGLIGPDQARRLRNLVWKLRFAMGRQPGRNDLSFNLEVQNADCEPAARVALLGVIGATDVDNPSPAITVMLSDED